jgi:hypothetical protein
MSPRARSELDCSFVRSSKELAQSAGWWEDGKSAYLAAGGRSWELRELDAGACVGVERTLAAENSAIFIPIGALWGCRRKVI